MSALPASVGASIAPFTPMVTRPGRCTPTRICGSHAHRLPDVEKPGAPMDARLRGFKGLTSGASCPIITSARVQRSHARVTASRRMGEVLPSFCPP